MRANAAVLYEVGKPVVIGGRRRARARGPGGAGALGGQRGVPQLKEMVSRRLPLSELNHAFDLMKQGEVKRRVIVYE